MRLFRVSFTVSWAFEVNVPADYGQAVWEAIHTAGREFDITPYGTETMHVLRAEKGYIIVGRRRTAPSHQHDAGLAWAIGKGKPDFVGKRGLARPAMHAPERKQLVGLLTVDPGDRARRRRAGGRGAPRRVPPMRVIGHVTSSYPSAVLGRSIALALVAGRAFADRTQPLRADAARRYRRDGHVAGVS
jgi:sarcosine oxidase subunit alpha